MGAPTDVALSALFGFCAPHVSQGMLPATFPSELIAPLTAEEKRKFTDESHGHDELYRIVSSDGFVLLDIRPDWCRVITNGGDPKGALSEFREKLKDAGGHEDSDEQTPENWERVTGMIPLRDGYSIVALFMCDTTNRDAGFFGSTLLVRKK